MLAHPNATASALTGSAAYALIWALHRYANITLSVRESLAIATGAITVILWIGRVGLQGAWLRILHGATTAARAIVKGSPESPAPVQPPTLDG